MAIPGVLFLYHRPTLPWERGDISNVDENIAAFGRHSRFPVWSVNTEEIWSVTPELGYEPRVGPGDFEAIALHYSLFRAGPQPYLMSDSLREQLREAKGYKLAFFQDEYHWCGRRFSFIDECGIDCVWTMLEPPRGERIYGEKTNASRVVWHLPGYVGEELTEGAARFSRPDSERTIDVAYRGRSAPAHWGRGGQEKRVIGERFAAEAADSGLRLDIEVDEGSRIYGADWHRFMGNSKGTLGSESGTSCFDLEDEVLTEYLRLSADGTEPSLEELTTLERWDGRITYRTLAPRNLEAAALRTCQILYEGWYSGAMEPMRHYIPLRKDHSNVAEVIERFKDAALRRELTENAHRDLIASGEYHYERFIAQFDAVLAEAGLRSTDPARRAELAEVDRALRPALRDRLRRYARTRLSWLAVNVPPARWVITGVLEVRALLVRLARRLLGRSGPDSDVE